ncbi:MAG TPA: response regulator [Clostridiales bacterium]|nr:response regulator [Clostridiales bacterium]
MKLMVVDDNLQVREGIHYGIPWEEYGIQEISEFGDGLEAAKALKVFQPDIIIADIRMPNMDGLQLLEQVKKKLNNCKFILISAYSEFSYAQKAINLGADDYILKPIKPGVLIEVVMKKIQEILGERKEKEAYYHIFEKSFIHALTQKSPIENEEKIKEFLENKYQFSLGHNLVFLAILRVEQADGKIPKKLIQTEVLDWIREQLQDFGVLISMGEKQLLLIGKGEPSLMISLNHQYQLKVVLSSINKKMMENNLAITAGISDCRGLKEISLVYSHAYEALEDTYYHERGSCLLFIQKNLNGERFPEKIQKDMMEAIRESLIQGDNKELHRHMEALHELGCQKRYPKNEMVAFLKRLYLYLVRRCDLESDLDFERSTIDNALHFSDCIRQFEKFLGHSAEKSSKPCNAENYSVMVRNICFFIEEHYDEPLSLESIGEVFERTPNYISSRFKKEVGKSFTDYLIELRIQKAVGLIKYTNTSIGEVAKKVGFSNYAYFSRIFRRYTGKNAGIFRSGNKDE